ncbi:phosphate ABC transporter substrate-binding protein [Prosthecobacter sp.]|uniref:phosphate ABC transporter substrate-binding protein n=1 Tax=Prosthecobacter sp. TaxID=1965333 RepID=UPI0037842404
MKAILFLLLAAEILAEDARPVISGIWMMGQSLCDGSESLPIVTEKDSGWGNLAFQRGVRTWLPSDHPSLPAQREAGHFAFTPLCAQANGGLGETAANGIADHWLASLVSGDKALVGKSAAPFLVACAGQGGRQIQELSIADLSTDARTPASRQHGGGYYKTSLDDARRAAAQAKAVGKEFRMAALYWMQGEGNGGPTGGIVPSRWDAELPHAEGLAWYRDQLTAYRRQWSADLCAITGQKGDLPLFTYQTLGPAGEAQLMAADADASIFLVGPHYAVPSAINSRTKPGRHGDPIHLAADGERWWGEQVGKVMHRVLDKGENWQPLRPRKARLESKRDSILIDFTVPRPPLVLDTVFLARQEIAAKDGFTSLAGFRVHDSAGQPVTLAAVEVSAPTQVRLRLYTPLPEGKKCRISYGHPFAAALGVISKLTEGAAPMAEMELPTSLSALLQPLLAEGAFFVTSISGPVTRVPIRAVSELNGTTTLRYLPGELRNGVKFEVGQNVVAQRSFSYGNLRDSDPESSVHRFADATFGTREGLPYPLWNWCVLFSDFSVD